MAMEQWSPFRDMLSLRDAMDRLMQSSFVRPSGLLAGQGTMVNMPLDVVERDNDYQIEAAMPGVNPDDVQISVQNDTLTIRGQVSRTETIPGSQQGQRQAQQGQQSQQGPQGQQSQQGQGQGEGAGQPNYLTRERYYGTYFRQVSLPTPVNADKAQAHFENGILYLTLPKAEEAKPKQIRISQSQQITSQTQQH